MLRAAATYLTRLLGDARHPPLGALKHTDWSSGY
jgi:hypothetical protein